MKKFSITPGVLMNNKTAACVYRASFWSVNAKDSYCYCLFCCTV